MGVMAGAADQTYHTYNWFFLAFRLLFGVLFSNLIAGILIGAFGRNEQERQTIVGEVKLALEQFAKLLLPKQQAKLQSELGIVAEQLLKGQSNTNLGCCIVETSSESVV